MGVADSDERGWVVGSIQCAQCGGSAVDHEGYCWTCEYHNEVAGPPPPGWIVPGEDPFEDLPPALVPERRKTRLRMIFIPPLITFVVIACAIGGYFAFRAADALMTAPPSGTETVVSPGAATSTGAINACVVGAWRNAAIDETIKFNGESMHVTGSGGVRTFAQDGTGVDNHDGRVVSGTSGGRAVTFTLSGSTPFRYTIFGKKIVFQFSGDKVPMTITVNGVVSPGEYSVTDGEAEVSCGTDTLKISTKTGGAITSSRVR